MFQLRFVWQNLKGKRLMFSAGIFLCVITATAVVVQPKLIQMLIDDFKKGNRKMLIPLLIIMCSAVFIRSSLRYLMTMLHEKSSQYMLVKIRKQLFHNLQYQELRFYGRNRTGDIITRFVGDLDYVRHVVAFVSYTFLDAIVQFLTAVIFLMTISVPFTLCLLAILPVVGIASKLYSSKVRPLYRNLREKLSELNTITQENIAGNRVVKAFAREEYEKEKFDEKSKEFKAANLTANYTWQKFSPVMEFLAQSLTLVTVAVGGIFVINGKMSIGSLIGILSLTGALVQPVRSFSNLLNDLQRFFASADKVIELYYAKPTIVTRHDAIDQKERLKGKIEFRNVTFKYDNSPVFENISFTIEPGETTAIMGPTGCGKTTLVSLISRFYDVTEGIILIDDVDVRLRTLDSLRSAVAVSTQDVFLFSDTVDGNIAYSDPEMSEEMVKDYAKASCADDFIRKLEDGYDTIIGERGVGLSGGQRQRIALARALASERPILILDDTTSAVDLETEKYIQDELRNLKFSCTKIIIAQRISSVINADKIIILENGKVTVGNHEFLAKYNRYYRDICELQDTTGLPVFAGGVLNGNA